jgi:hypothetical protein
MTFKQKMGLAAAVSAALGFSGAAGAVANIYAYPGHVYTTEALASASAATETFSFYVDSMIDIAPDNSLTLSFSGIPLTNTSAPTVTCNGTVLVPVVGTGVGGTYEYVNNSGSSTNSSCCHVTGVSTTIAKLKAAAAGGHADLNVAAQLFSVAGGVKIDYAPRSGQGYGNTTGYGCLPLAAVVEQYSAEVDKSNNGLTATIDLTSGSFGVDFTSTYSRELEVHTSDYCNASYPADGACALSVGVGQSPLVETVVTGNFSFADNGGTNCDDSAAAPGALYTTDYNGQVDGKVNVGCGSVTSYSYAPGNNTYVKVESGTNAGGGSELLPFSVGSFTQETSVTWQKALNTPATEILSSGPAGAWTTNGFTAFIPYMPYDAQGTLSRVIYVTNATGKPGTVSVTVGAEGTACTEKNVATAAAAGVTQLSGAVDAAVASCFPTLPANGKVWVAVAADFPSQNGSQIYSAYVQNGQRYIVINTSNNNTL